MELPNLTFIKEIAEDDIAFQNSILDIIKKEFPAEVESFNKNFAGKNYLEASKDVHKLKHKISLLGLKEGLVKASQFEKDFLENNIELHGDFVEILNKIDVYLYK
jgi:hypothetical protein